ncbi:hypothetical protein NF27_CY00110 [Candidatus Jidaibacter acanthamoeba]|uniref:J domain-containing protein n=1 Tax=Candidatus Jidaibacter acanthamoebae TaxID=86105 RepID=A0A0C1R0E1_9RICK|nr:HNH endonuclease [Candidatus Jidaibacter acanthamoeba]KIE05775.1 hypothetical protein NF27_CY00110 [Candidatus Jidaibacter acanthamoeba]
MKNNIFKILGLNKDVSAGEIHKKYRKQALVDHPDKGGDIEKFRELQNAYSAWMNFPELAQLDDEEDPDLPEKPINAEYIESSRAPYSEQLKAKHKKLIEKYRQEKLPETDIHELFKKFEADLYKEKFNIFAFAANQFSSGESPTQLEYPKMTPNLAVGVFTGFLKGEYRDSNLSAVKQCFEKAIRELKNTKLYHPEIELYDSMLSIIRMVETDHANTTDLLSSIKRITDYAKTSDETISIMAPLIENKYFRDLFARVMRSYWREDSVGLNNREIFDGQEDTGQELKNLKARISKDSPKEMLSLIHYLNVLYRAERNLNEKEENSRNLANNYRGIAYYLADLTMALIDRSSRQITINTLIQAGAYFQRAANCESAIDIERMADEQLALNMYLAAIQISSHATPDVKLYAITQSLKGIGSFRFGDDDLAAIIEALQIKCLKIADIYPIFEPPKSNIAFFKKGNESIILMRRFLHALVKNSEERQFEDNESYGHTRINILYQAYEASLKGWYEEEHNKEQERQFRLELMGELLAKDNWTFEDLDKNIDTPWVMVDRDAEGWMNPSNSLPLTEDPEIKIYGSLNGFEVNNETGEISFQLKEWNANDPEYSKLFTINDLNEMLERKTSCISFSLDPVDLDMHYHPFNKVFFEPESLYQTQFLSTALLADYILKFLTMGKEVQGRYPYDIRPIDRMIEHMPEHLKKIIYDFHKAKQSNSIHRFWIEAEGIDIAEEAKKEVNVQRVALDHLKMVVKKHKMAFDKDGNLVDLDEKDEGWQFYIISDQMKIEQEIEELQLKSPSIIFKENKKKIYFYEDGKISPAYPYTDSGLIGSVLREPRTEVKSISTKPIFYAKNTFNKVESIRINSSNAHIFYHITKHITGQVKREHHFSPEYIFAREFTANYDEFAQYLPIFGQLRELSKVCTSIHLLGNLRKENKKSAAYIREFFGLKDSVRRKLSQNLEEEQIPWDDLLICSYHSGAIGWCDVIEEIAGEGDRICKMHSNGKNAEEIIYALIELKSKVIGLDTVYNFAPHSVYKEALHKGKHTDEQIQKKYDKWYSKTRTDYINSHGRIAWFRLDNEAWIKMQEEALQVIKLEVNEDTRRWLLNLIEGAIEKIASMIDVRNDKIKLKEEQELLATKFSNFEQGLSKVKIAERVKEQLKSIREQIGTLHISSKSQEVEEHYKDWYNKRKEEAGWFGWWTISSEEWKKEVYMVRKGIARQLSQNKRRGWHEELSKSFAPALGDRTDSLIKDFLNGYENVMIRMLVDHEHDKVIQQLQEKLSEHDRLEDEYKKIGFGREKGYKPDLSQACWRVPASIDSEEGRLAYGGVLIIPRIRTIERNNQRSQQIINNAFASNNSRVNSANIAATRAANASRGSVSGANNPSYTARREAAASNVTRPQPSSSGSTTARPSSYAPPTAQRPSSGSTTQRPSSSSTATSKPSTTTNQRPSSAGSSNQRSSTSGSSSYSSRGSSSSSSSSSSEKTNFSFASKQSQSTTTAGRTETKKKVPDTVEKIGKNLPRNAANFTGKKVDFDKLPESIKARYPNLKEKYPDGIWFKENGCPNFTPHAILIVEVTGLNGEHGHDSGKANKAVGYKETPDGYTWHHHEDGKTMELVPKDLHDAIKHTGGASKLRHETSKGIK